MKTENNRISQIKKNRGNHINLIIIMVLMSAFSLHAQRDTRGNDFWLTFGRNSDRYEESQSYPTPLTLQIRIVAGEGGAKGRIEFTESGTDVAFTIPPNQVFTHPLTDPQKRAACNAYQNTMDRINSRSVHITTDSLVTVYALNQYQGSTDATNILPLPILGTDYYNLSYDVVPSSLSTAIRYIDAYAVVATQANSKIYQNGTLLATLNTGQVFYRYSTNDMTGIHITADKPIAFFAVNQDAVIPKGFDYADHLFQQLAPVNTWGKNFFVPVSHLGQDIVRIVAAQSGTTITQTGGTVQTGTLTNLNAGQWVELLVSRTNNGCHITTNKPVGVCTYLTGTKFNGDKGSDPSEAWLPAIEQTVKSALIAPFNSSGISNINEHYALIVTPTATKNNTKVKTGVGAEELLTAIPGVWTDNVSAKMSFFTMKLTDKISSYLFTNDAGLLVMVYGMGLAESYYYLASSSMLTLDAAFYVNDIHYQNITSADIFCNGNPITITAKIEEHIFSAINHIQWYIDGTLQTAHQDALNWSETFASGKHQIKMEVIMQNGIDTITAETTITVEESTLNRPNDMTLCADATSQPVIFTGTHVDTVKWEVTSGSGIAIGMPDERGTGTIPSFTAKNATADSLSITVTATPKSKTDCEGQPQTFTITVYSRASLEINLGNDTTICKSDSLLLNAEHPNAVSYQWQDGSELPTYLVEKSGIYSVTVTNSCMSVSDRIEVKIKDCIVLEIRIPNAFTPDGDGINDIFKPEISNPELLKEYEMVIYNRWGNLIFRTQDYLMGWNGKDNKGKSCSIGVYAAIVKYKDMEGQNFIRQVSITLVK